MYARTVPGPEKQPSLRDFLDEPDTPLDIRVPPPRVCKAKENTLFLQSGKMNILTKFATFLCLKLID